jgi:hypothetical protein
MEPGMNAQLYTLRDVTRLPTGGKAKFLRTTGMINFGDAVHPPAHENRKQPWTRMAQTN